MVYTLDRIIGPERGNDLANLLRCTDGTKVERGGLGNVLCEAFAERRGVVGVDASVIRRTRYGDVSEPVIDETAIRIGVDIGEDTPCRESLELWEVTA